MFDGKPAFDLWYEDLGEGRANLHCVVNRWNHTVAQQLEHAVNLLVKELVVGGYHTAYAIGPDHPHFCEYMGGDHIGTITHDGLEYEVFQWELLHQLSE